MTKQTTPALPADTRASVNRTAARILARLEPGTVWAPQQETRDSDQAAA